MMSDASIALTYVLVLLIISLIALMMKLMIFVLAADDWWELRDVPSTLPERMVADDEVVASALRVVSVMVVVGICIVWLLRILLNIPVLTLVMAMALGLATMAILANIQGMRALIFRRRMARILNRRRRPVGLQVEDCGDSGQPSSPSVSRNVVPGSQARSDQP